MNEEKKQKLIRRFSAMVSPNSTPNGCRAWLGHVRPNGYGTFELCEGGEASGELAHRVAYAIGADAFSILRLYGGPRDKRGPVVRHIGPGDGKPCDFKHCVEFAHLAMGSQRENINDNVEHGTILVGSKVGTSKLTEEQARALAAEYAAACRVNGGKAPYGFATALGKKFGVRRQVAWEIATGRGWKHLKK